MNAYRRKRNNKELILFVILSLIIGFVAGNISHDSVSIVESLKSQSSKVTNSLATLAPNITEVVPIEHWEGEFGYMNYETCSNVKLVAERQGYTSFHEDTCTSICGELNLNYYSYSCEKDKFVCQCKD